MLQLKGSQNVVKFLGTHLIDVFNLKSAPVIRAIPFSRITFGDEKKKPFDVGYSLTEASFNNQALLLFRPLPLCYSRQ